jgi:UDP-3-O-[3-hydroxymyristoyl] N-acetylglucosamine deacetylase
LSSYYQHTLAGPIRVAGVGIHTGLTVTLDLKPAPADAGIVFVRTDLPAGPQAIPAVGESVCETRLGTVIGNEAGATVSTIEHLMAVFAGLGVDNVVVEIDGPEAPIMEGSSALLLGAVDEVGLRRQDAPRRHILILEPIEVSGPGKRAALLPAETFEMAVEIIFDSPAIGHQSLDLVMDEAAFRTELAEARTFGFMSEVEQLRAAGLGRGASLENTIVIEDDRVLNPEGLLRPDEFVRHKALDALGDLYLLGAPIIGRYESSCSGHALNNALVRALIDRPEAWRFVTHAPELAQAV